MAHGVQKHRKPVVYTYIAILFMRNMRFIRDKLLPVRAILSAYLPVHVYQEVFDRTQEQKELDSANGIVFWWLGL